MGAKLALDKNQQTAFLKQTLQTGMLHQTGSAFYIDPKIITRGEYDEDSDHIRIFADYYRKLCESTRSQADLNRVYYFLQMIPYLNRQTNILAYNETEQDLDRIACMPFNEFCKKINFNIAHSAKLKKQLSTFRVYGESIIGFFDDLSELTPSGKYAVLNPKLCFGGDRSNSKYKNICTLFENEKNTWIALQKCKSSSGDGS